MDKAADSRDIKTCKLEFILHTVINGIQRFRIKLTWVISNISQMRDIDFLIRKSPEFNDRTLTTFETKEAYNSEFNDKSDIEKIRKNKKCGFNQNSGVLKVSTIHSYKGYESPTVFLILNEEDSPELVYVGVTRAKFNLVVFFEEKSKYADFFKMNLEFVEHN